MKPKTTLLIVEDEKHINHFIQTNLKSHNYKAIPCYTGKEALCMLASHCPDLILLDLGLPDMDGIAVIKAIRKLSNTPIIVISARTEEEQKVEALDLGADDYITKPFGTSELLARIRTTLRHSQKLSSAQANEPQVFHTGNLVLDFSKHLLTINSKQVHLTLIEYKLVSLLAQNAGKVLTYDSIIDKIWGPYASKDNQILRVNMANIRRKIEANPADPQYIFTEVGVGYRMVEETLVV